jgi:hypothetical protein
MPVHMIAYTSLSVIPPAYQARELADIVDKSLLRNAASDVTGMLIFTEERFAQSIEGPAEAVRTIMASIRRDPRHSEIVTLHDGPIPARNFAGWSLGYRHYSMPIDTLIRSASYEAGLSSHQALADLIELMKRLGPAG